MKTNKVGFAFCTVLFFACLPAKAIELMSSADMLESKNWALSLYGRAEKYEPVIKLSGSRSNGITVPLPPAMGVSTLFPDLNAEVSMDAEHEEEAVAFSFRPGDGLHYRLVTGVVNNFKVDFDSGTHTNSLRSLSNGFLYGAGIRWNVAPGTIVSSAIALDLSYMHKQVKLDRFQSNGTTTATDLRYAENEFQAALNVSRRFKKVEPFGGLKVFQTQSRLSDQATAESVAGKMEGWSPFVGLSWEIFPKENLIVEASFADEESISAGMTVKF